jgi:hypothetical protein
MSVKCGNKAKGDHYHESAAEVKACYAGSNAPVLPPAYAGNGAKDGTDGPKATEKQAKFLASLLQRDGSRLVGGLTPDTVSKRTASVLIDNLIQRGKARGAGNRLPSLHPDLEATGEPVKEPEERKPFPRVPAGHYATPSATGNNDLDFWRVDVPEDGRWKGYQFVKRVIGGRPSVAVKGSTARAALEAIIANGIDKSGVLYGQTIGRCRFCNRHLTDEVSRQFGAGPDCRAARGIG